MKNNNETLAGRVAKTFADAFERKTRHNGEAFTSIKDDAPEWVSDAVREAHYIGDDLRFPDDWIYRQCENFADAIYIQVTQCGCDHNEVLNELNCEADANTFDLLQWFSSDIRNVELFDEYVAVNGFSLDDNPYGDGRTGMLAVVAGVQVEMKQHIAGIVAFAYGVAVAEEMDEVTYLEEEVKP